MGSADVIADAAAMAAQVSRAAASQPPAPALAKSPAATAAYVVPHKRRTPDSARDAEVLMSLSPVFWFVIE